MEKKVLIPVSAEDCCRDIIEQLRQKVIKAIDEVENLDDPTCESYLFLLNHIECSLCM